MADLLNAPTLSKLHQALSRRSLMREMALGAAVAVVPVSAIAASAPAPTPRERLSALIEELKIAAVEVNPTICDWRVSIADKPGEMGCCLLIAAFEPRVESAPAQPPKSRRKKS